MLVIMLFLALVMATVNAAKYFALSIQAVSLLFVPLSDLRIEGHADTPPEFTSDILNVKLLFNWLELRSVNADVGGEEAS